MRRLVIACLCLLVLSTTLIMALKTLSGGSSEPSPVIIEDQYTPGHTRPVRASCGPWYSADGRPSVSCRAIQQDGSEVYYSIDPEYAGEITYASLQLTDKYVTVGQLILQWGTPTGYTANKWGRTVYWSDNKFAYIINSDSTGPGFTPNSGVGFIAYDLNSRPAGPWRGFVLYPTEAPTPRPLQ